MSITQMGVDSEGSDFSPSDAEDAILNQWLDAGTLSNDDGGAKLPKRRTETVTEDAEEDNNESDDDLDLDDDEDDQDADAEEGSDTTDDKDEDKADEPTIAADEAVVRVTVDGEERTVPVKDLKRLFGQEASLTRKSQEVAQVRKSAEEEGARFTLATQKLMERAGERFKPYAEIDWTIAAKTLDNEEYIALRQEAQAAYQDLKFLKEEFDGAFKATQDARQTQNIEAAKEAVAVLKRDIPNWSQETYTGVIDYAANNGLDRDFIAQVTDANVIKLLHKAMSYDMAKERAATKRKAATSKHTMKSSNKRPTAALGKPDGKAELAKLAKSGSQDDAAALLLSRWNSEGDD